MNMKYANGYGNLITTTHDNEFAAALLRYGEQS